MKVLKLNLKKEWFDLILNGHKTEEYREVKRHWIVRLLSENDNLTDLAGVKSSGASFQKYELVQFANGYSKTRRQITMEIENISIGQGESKWGAINGQEYFVIKLGRVVNRQNC